MSNPTPYKFAALDGDAVIFNDHDAFIHQNGKWQEMSNAEAFAKAQLLSKDMFVRMFGQIEQDLPETFK